ncbi:MAG: ribbon-helix-helix protein, CopG family [Thermofilaceae archaeon]
MAGRPRKLKEPGVTLSAHVPLSLKQKVEEVANARGVSVSDIVRLALEEYLQRMGAAQEASAAGADPPPDPPQPDPLTLLEVEDLRDAVSQLERQVAQLEAMAKPFLVGRSGPRVLTSRDLEERRKLQKRVCNIREEWYEKKRWWARLNREIPLDDVKQKLIELHGRIKTVEKAL